MKQHHDDLHALAAAYALDALDPADRKAFTAHLAGCAACRREVAEFQATTARMAAATARTPPPALKPQVMAAIETVRQLPPRVTPTASVNWRGVLRRHAGTIAVAAGLTAAATFAGVAAWQHQENVEAGRRATQSEQRLDEMNSVLSSPDARTVHARAGNGAATSVVSSRRLDKTVFTAAGLPAPGTGKTYQLWLDHNGTMRPAGLLPHDGAVLLTGDTAGARAVGLTLEPAGGSARPTTPPLVLLPLPA
ncbi:anti-sigma factor [Streptomyces sp. A1136]|uniref:anti-sigma factor n=2 Tax=unclassified Streptomyces TaxID=2593676 RepID=UPI00109E9818|nr:anti-sigma factor [Streptomyces sp. A1136]THA50600.1 anti-sigma factor [Streptomyces sp. A1136]